MALGESVKNTLKQTAAESASMLTKPVTDALAAGINAAIAQASPDMLNKLQQAFAAAKALPEETPSQPYSDATLSLYRILGVIGAITGAPMGLLPVVGDSYASGYGANLQHVIRAAFLPSRLTPDLLLQAELRDPALSKWTDSDLQDLGYSPERIEILRRLKVFLPGVQDLVRMAVREVFSPDVVARFGQASDFPPDFAEQAAKQGVSPEVAQWYWAAHWELPSAGQGFEMLHRGVITREELDLLLRTLDVMPFWRDKLVNIAYNPFTRVDVRRMYQQKILDADGVKRAYLDLGYDEDKAAKLTEFTVKLYPEDAGQAEVAKSDLLSFYAYRLIDKDRLTAGLKAAGIADEDVQLYISRADKVGFKDETAQLTREFTKSELLAAYQSKIINVEQLTSGLADLGYGDDQVQQYVVMEDYKSAKAEQNAWEDVYHDLYIRGIVDRTAVTAAFSAKGYETAYLENLFDRWDLERIRSRTKPTKAELIVFWQKGIITPDRLVTELQLLGYTDEAIGWYLQDKAK